VVGSGIVTLESLLGQLAACAPSERIELRDDILASGTDCIAPLTALVASHPELNASVAAWLELLANRDADSRPASIFALRKLGAPEGGAVARQALDRLGATSKPKSARIRTAKPRRDAGAEVHARLIVAAKAGRIVTYSELETSRGHIGRYLHRIALEEADARHPPLTAIVVSKSNGRPGDGFMPAMVETGFAVKGETLAAVWPRAVAAVHEYWRSAPSE
jgi:hypothetical protein